MAKFKALDIANFFVQLSNDLPEENITNLKLNKLCYYAQGWSIAKLGYPLFDEDIQAWDYGPVIKSVYETYKVCGKNPIAEPSASFDEKKLSTDELNLLIDVYSTYGKFSPGQLVTMTHAPGGPWSDVYKKRENNVITGESMSRYFKESEKLDSVQLNITPGNVVNYA